MDPMTGTPPRRASTPWALLAAILSLALASVAYRLLVVERLEQTSALFIGLPTLLALALAATPRAKSALGIIMKGMTIGLLMSGIVLGEGFICILMAAPLFYFVGLVIGLILNAAARRRARPAMLLLFLPLSLEGTHETLSFRRAETVSVERVVLGSAADVGRALAGSPRFDRPLPIYLRLGFPRPEEARGSGLDPGDRRVIHFGGGEGKPGDLVLEVADHTPGRVVFRILSDRSHVAHWLDWKEADVRWQAIDATHTRVVWRLAYDRRLDPAWYFGPWERYAVGLTAGYLVEGLATPR